MTAKGPQPLHRSDSIISEDRVRDVNRAVDIGKLGGRSGLRSCRGQDLTEWARRAGAAGGLITQWQRGLRLGIVNETGRPLRFPRLDNKQSEGGGV